MWKKFSIFNIFMREFITLSVALTIVCLLVLLFWFFYSLPLWIVWNYVVSPIFGSSALSLFESFMMMIGFNIIYVVITLLRTQRIDDNQVL